MGFISRLVLGILFGILIVYGWSRMMEHRSRKRVAKAADLKLLGSMSQDDLKKLCGDNFPEWISFPEFESVKWLNKMLSRIWPFVAEGIVPLCYVIRHNIAHNLELQFPIKLRKLWPYWFGEPLSTVHRSPSFTSAKFDLFYLIFTRMVFD